MTISYGKRFEVFKRDGFKCKYCGLSSSENVTLEVDHVIPKSKGGPDILDNLITACLACNRGKSDIEIGKSIEIPFTVPEGILSESLCSESEAGAYLSISVRTLQGWRSSGKGPHFIRISRRCIRYRKKELDEWVSNKIRKSTCDLGEEPKSTIQKFRIVRRPLRQTKTNDCK